MTRLREKFGWIAFGAFWLAAAGIHCAVQETGAPAVDAKLVFTKRKKSRPAPTILFSHALHVGENEMDCADCHGEDGEISVPMERGTRGCEDCHDVGDREEPSDDCAACHLAKDRKVRWPQGPRLPGLVYDHGRHKTIDCKNCHGGYDKKDGVAAASPGDMDSCQACHLKKKPLACTGCHENLDTLRPRSHGAENWNPVHGVYAKLIDRTGGRDDCAGCHGKTPCRDCHLKKKPRSHGKTWIHEDHAPSSRKKPTTCAVCHRADFCTECHGCTKPTTHSCQWPHIAHGQSARADSERCDHCHRPAFCDACHTVEAPRDHTNHFRQMGHGMEVTVDRDRCRVCHSVAFCVRCHAEVSPRSHTLGWNNPTNRHCRNCHWPPGSGPENCTLCHRSFPGHAPQKAKPPSHASYSANCLLCHANVHETGSNACADCHP